MLGRNINSQQQGKEDAINVSMDVPKIHPVSVEMHKTHISWYKEVLLMVHFILAEVSKGFSRFYDFIVLVFRDINNIYVDDWNHSSRLPMVERESTVKRDNRSSREELERNMCSHSSSVNADYTRNDGTGNRDCLVEVSTPISDFATKRGRASGPSSSTRFPRTIKLNGGRIMVFSLSANSFGHVSYQLRKGSRIRYYVESERAINVYIVDSENMEYFMRGHEWDYEYGTKRKRIHEGTFKAPYADTWTMIMWNESGYQIAVSYEIS